MSPSTPERRRGYLAAMGVDVWRLRGQAGPRERESMPAAAPQGQQGTAPAATPAVARSAASAVPAAPATPHAATPTAVQSAPRSPIVSESLPRGDSAQQQWPDWESLQQAVSSCTRCELHQRRHRTVFGGGDRNADWVIVGEAPGADEDRLGEPFVGVAGRLLDEMLRAVGYTREQVFIANLLKCRPPHNRDPLVAESACCRPFLDRQLELLGPKVIAAFGRIAAQNLLETDLPMYQLRGRVHDYHGTPLVVTYHPAYLLRSPAEKRKSWDDLRSIWRLLHGGGA